MRKIDQFAYINNYYALDLKKNRSVIKADGDRGIVTKADGAHIYIQWENEPKPKGPYHPTWDLTYPEAGS